MTGPVDQASGGPERGPHRRGLGARLWVGVLGASGVTALAAIGVVLVLRESEVGYDTRTLILALMFAGVVGLLVAALLGAWLVRGVVGGVRRICHGVTAGHLADPHPRSSIPDWGEIGDLAAAVRGLLQRQRQLVRVENESLRVSADLARVVAGVERWVVTERWEFLRIPSPSLAPLVDGLNQGFSRWAEVCEQNREVARSIRIELEQAIQEARKSTQGAEHGFVEATALLTTLREIARLGSEIQLAVTTRAATAPPSGATDWQEQAARSLDDLVGVSSDSVRHLGDGLLRVQEISSQVQLVSNRATLVALNALMSGSRARESSDAWTTELRQLAREVREATDRVQALTSEIESDVEAANDRMQEVRERTRTRLTGLQETTADSGAEEDPAGILRLAERLREMVQDAARKGERLSETGETASHAAEGLARHLEDALSDMAGLAVRLGPAGVETPAVEYAVEEVPGPRLLDEDDAGRTGGDRHGAERP